MGSQSHSMNYSLCKVQECVETPFTERWSIIEQAKIKDFHTTITHTDNKTITVWLSHKQTKKKKNPIWPCVVGFCKGVTNLSQALISKYVWCSFDLSLFISLFLYLLLIISLSNNNYLFMFKLRHLISLILISV